MKVETNLVTDPYSLSLSTNSQRSQIVDLADPALAPAGWSSLVKPPLAAPEDIVLYELHVRDFSANDPTVPAAPARHLQGVHGRGSNGMKHLKSLAQCRAHARPSAPGVRLRHHRRGQVELAAAAVQLVELPPDSESQQSCVMSVAGSDGFNWGYDPWHYTVPEGSYATNPDGSAAQRRVPPDGPVAEQHRPAHGDGRRLQPHQRVRPERQVGARPDRARLLPPPRRQRQRRALDVLREHRARARDDGQAGRRLRRDLGEVLQGRRVPLRHHGPPPKGEHARRSPRTRRPHARKGRRGRKVDLPLRRGLELRRGRERRAVRAGAPGEHGRYGHRHVQRPPARRGARRRTVRRSSSAGLRDRAGLRPERHARERFAHRPPRAHRLGQGRSRRRPQGLQLRRPLREPRARRSSAPTTTSRPATPPIRRS